MITIKQWIMITAQAQRLGFELILDGHGINIDSMTSDYEDCVAWSELDGHPDAFGKVQHAIDMLWEHVTS